MLGQGMRKRPWDPNKDLDGPRGTITNRAESACLGARSQSRSEANDWKSFDLLFPSAATELAEWTRRFWQLAIADLAPTESQYSTVSDGCSQGLK